MAEFAEPWNRTGIVRSAKNNKPKKQKIKFVTSKCSNLTCSLMCKSVLHYFISNFLHSLDINIVEKKQCKIAESAQGGVVSV